MRTGKVAPLPAPAPLVRPEDVAARDLLMAAKIAVIYMQDDNHPAFVAATARLRAAIAAADPVPGGQAVAEGGGQ